MSQHPIGTRFKVVQTRAGTVNPRFVGATGEVTEHLGSRSHRVRFDDESLSNGGTWSRAALSPLADFDTVEAAGLDGTGREGGPHALTDLDPAVEPADRVFVGGTDFYVGQRVEVVGYSDAWDGPATVTDGWLSNIVVNPDREGRGEGRFDVRFIRALDESGIIDPDDVDALRRELDETLLQAVAEGAALQRQLDEVRDTLKIVGKQAEEDTRRSDETIVSLQADLASRTLRLSEHVGLLKDAEAERDRLAKALDYALDLMTVAQQSRVAGFMDGLKS
jgi:hypothetical protein